MAGNVFKYNEIKTVYDNIKKINGNSSDADSIAGILFNINKKVEESVNVEDESIFGELGSQILLDWDNTSSNFPTFVEKLDTWSAVVAEAAGNYAQFEADYKGFIDDNSSNGQYLGMSAGGRSTSYVADGIFSTYTSQGLVDLKSNISPYYALTGIGYIDTGDVAFEEKRQFNSKLAFGLNCLSIVLSVYGMSELSSAGGAAAEATTSLVAQNVDDVGNAALQLVAQNADDAGSAALQLVAQNADDVGSAALQLVTQNADDVAMNYGAAIFDKAGQKLGDIVVNQSGQILGMVDDAGNLVANSDTILRMCAENPGLYDRILQGAAESGLNLSGITTLVPQATSTALAPATTSLVPAVVEGTTTAAPGIVANTASMWPGRIASAAGGFMGEASGKINTEDVPDTVVNSPYYGFYMPSTQYGTYTQEELDQIMANPYASGTASPYAQNPAGANPNGAQ